jgi:DegV family protein with EDD domain
MSDRALARPAQSQLMPNVCILTDSSAQFTQPKFPGYDRVHVIPFDLQVVERQEDWSLPGGVFQHRRLVPPSPQEFIRNYARLGRDYDSILVLMLSSLFSTCMSNALVASEQYNNGAVVEVMDSLTTALGLGMLVQIAAQAASEGASLKEIDRQLRASIPRVYLLLCIPELTCLAQSGHMEYAQALVGEMMGMLPIFTFEDGRLVPMEKVRTPRHLFEAFQDFLGEFEAPARIALVNCSGRGSLRTSPLRQFVQDTFPETLFSEHALQPHLAAMFGPRSIGLVVLESTDQRPG